VPTYQNDPIVSKTTTQVPAFSGGVYGESTVFNGVRGVTYAPSAGGVVGVSENHTQQAGPGVFGQSDGTGVWGQSKTWMGVYGYSDSTTGGAGVMGEATGPGVIGKSKTWHGTYGETLSTTGGAGVWGEHKANGYGVVGNSSGGVGVFGVSQTGEAMHAETHSANVAAIAAYNLNPQGTGAAVYAKKAGAVGHAGFFDGDVHVTGSISVDRDVVLVNGDCAEEFDVEDPASAEPGTVMILGDGGALRPSGGAYDKRVAGVIAGAGAHKPAIILDRQPGPDRRPIVVVGKTACKVDAQYGAIEVGDLLTTSMAPGYAMKAADPLRAFGAVIGKALEPLREGRGLVRILVGLH